MQDIPVMTGQSPAPAIFVGTSGWAYSSWKPGFYPPRLSAKKFLEHYATRLNTVEVNYSFRALPTGQMLSNWLSATGDNFRLSFKAPQRITHMLRLKNCTEPLTAFMTAIEPVTAAGRTGVVLFQLPPNFKADLCRLDEFLTCASHSNPRLAFEFRHESWFHDDVYATLLKHKVAMCIAESDDLKTPAVRTAGFTCFRLRRSDYSKDELAAIAAQLQSASLAGDVFAYFKHEDEPAGALRAEAVLMQLATQR